MGKVPARPGARKAPSHVARRAVGAREIRAARRTTLISVLFLAGTLALVGLIVFSPTSPDLAGQQALATWLDRARQTWLPAWVTIGFVEFAANATMFLPVGVFGALALPRRRWSIVAASLFISIAIEAAQHLWLPSRDADLRDVAANTLGALVGYLLALAWTRHAAARHHRRER